MNEEKAIRGLRLTPLTMRLRLLNKRAAIALKVGEVKRRNDTSLCDHNREREVLTRLFRQNSGPLDNQNVTNIFQRVIDECLHVQQRAYHASSADDDKTQIGIKPFAEKDAWQFSRARNF